MQKFKTVEEFLTSLDADKKAQVLALRDIILQAHAGLDEHIKWNAPSYSLDGVDRVTFNLLNKEGVVKLVLHMDTARKEDKKGVPIMTNDDGLITWVSDIRGTMQFQSVADIQSRAETTTTLFARWLDIKV